MILFSQLWLLYYASVSSFWICRRISVRQHYSTSYLLPALPVGAALAR